MVNLCLSFLIFGLLETSYKRNMLVYDGLSKNNISHFGGFVDQKMVKCVVNLRYIRGRCAINVLKCKFKIQKYRQQVEIRIEIDLFCLQKKQGRNLQICVLFKSVKSTLRKMIFNYLYFVFSNCIINELIELFICVHEVATQLSKP